MKGQNTLELNEATMIEALQLWAEETFVKAPKVIKGEQTEGCGHQSSNQQKLFHVMMEEVESEVGHE